MGNPALNSTTFGISREDLYSALLEKGLDDNPITHIGMVSSNPKGDSEPVMSAIGYYRRTDGTKDDQTDVSLGTENLVADYYKRSEDIGEYQPSSQLNMVKGWSFHTQPLGPGEIIVIHPTWTVV